MSTDFIKGKHNNESLVKAKRQQKQLLYLTNSDIQDEVTESYLKQWAERKYSTNDHFLSYIKSVFKTENFLQFYKFLRFPLSSAELINDRIKTELERIYHSEDSYFKYSIFNRELEDLSLIESNKLNKSILDYALFRFNDVVVQDLDFQSNPINHIVSINDIVSIDCDDNMIEKIAYFSELHLEGREVYGYLYVDSKEYRFYDKELSETPIIVVPHDLGYCPATFISQTPFEISDPIIRRSLFSYVRADLEEYNFLKTLIKMQEPNGVLPIITQLSTKEKNKSNETTKVQSGAPMSLTEISGQQPEFREDVMGSSGSGAAQAGTVYKIPMVRKNDGSIDMDLAKNYLTFFYIPVEPLKYINERIAEIEERILKSTVGVISSRNNSTKNELQVESEYIDKEDRLRKLSASLSQLREFNDRTMLGLKYGINNVRVDLFYGSRFFLESISDLYDQLKNSPNAIESKSLLNRLSRIRNKFNARRSDRDAILYSILPYIVNTDFALAVESNQVSPEIFQLQSRFDYWVTKFESMYGDIVSFWDSLGDLNDSEKTIIINDLILKEVQTAIMPININS